DPAPDVLDRRLLVGPDVAPDGGYRRGRRAAQSRHRRSQRALGRSPETQQADERRRRPLLPRQSRRPARRRPRRQRELIRRVRDRQGATYVPGFTTLTLV